VLKVLMRKTGNAGGGNLGFGDRSALHPRLPRLAFSEACSLL
jgi:hypothetical protein